MATVIYLDTHVVAWLFAGQQARLSAAGRRAVEAHDLLVSPAVLLELQFLFETKRTATANTAVVENFRIVSASRSVIYPFQASLGRPSREFGIETVRSVDRRTGGDRGDSVADEGSRHSPPVHASILVNARSPAKGRVRPQSLRVRHRGGRRNAPLQGLSEHDRRYRRASPVCLRNQVSMLEPPRAVARGRLPSRRWLRRPPDLRPASSFMITMVSTGAIGTPSLTGGLFRTLSTTRKDSVSGT